MSVAVLNLTPTEFDLYQSGLARIESRREVLGGEPVFRGTRLSVRHVGGMVANGVTSETIREDYPVLSEEDIAFATLYTRVEPAPGRSGMPLRVVRAPAGA